MASSSPTIAVLSQQLDDFLTAQRAHAAQYGAEATLMLESAHRAVAGGKRLRARFCLAGWESVTAQGDMDAPLTVAAALEVFHAAALVHDDLIDNSDTRRGRPSAHRALESEHTVRGWRGDAAAFGRAGGILIGDLLLSLSDELFERGVGMAPPDAAIAARTQYEQMRREVTIGQFLDVAEESAYASAPAREQAERALRVASLKSARYSVQQPLLIGASLAGADQARRDALSAFGLPVGMAFQLRDDVLGVFGDEQVTGKPAGDDLREGKRTVLIAFAREAVAEPERNLIDGLLGDPSLDDGQIETLQHLIRTSGALDRVEALIERYSSQADDALASGALPDAATALLRDLGRAATVRTA